MKRALVFIAVCLVLAIPAGCDKSYTEEEKAFMKEAELKIESLLHEDVTVTDMLKGEYIFKILISGYVNRVDYPFEFDTNEELNGFDFLSSFHLNLMSFDAREDFEDIINASFPEKTVFDPDVHVGKIKTEEKFLSYKQYKEKYAGEIIYSLTVDRDVELNQETVEREAKATYAFIQSLRAKGLKISFLRMKYPGMVIIDLKNFSDPDESLDETAIGEIFKEKLDANKISK
ncbi:hypothetical protein PAECIP111893_02851 [Paenibacillus plantiphilus]|uniref:Lipoprotein n=1 Tax=Paenibacillus plantiphilus TaxID=2905650 RepID=A0ABN8GI89_9BACL|nr:hypothetical protein [Paenibacillus plantiphilus]CAH1208169.1 hypothetical protein PAECIP111893_02851 [Paenibacillus plantiphilus]